MNFITHRSTERGYANHGWLKSHHSFSFADYYNPNRIHFGALRVLNDDTVLAGYGFGKHPHENMEIISIPLSGDLHHQDSTGRDRIIKQGDVQIMSAGSGITHSEKNANQDQEVKFLQIWILPKIKNIDPRYDQKSFPINDRLDKWQLVVAPDNPQALWINQDAWLSLGRYQKDQFVRYDWKNPKSGLFIFLIYGEIKINDELLCPRDAMEIRNSTSITLQVTAESEILLIEVPL